MNRIVWIGIAVVSVILIAGTYIGSFQFDWLEVAGFIFGLVSVWLAVKNSPWNWPIGNLECAAYFVLFFNGKLFANATLQLIFIVIGFWGWYQWLRGGKNATPLPITHWTRRLAIILLILTPISTFVVGTFLSSIDGAAPFWDTFTTVLSLVATYVMGKRHIENWLIWIVADVIYILLFISRGLYLTSVLYFLFLLMCLRGYWEWKRTLDKERGKRDEGIGHREVLPVS